MPRPLPIDRWQVAVEFPSAAPHRGYGKLRRALGLEGPATRPSTSGRKLTWPLDDGEPRPLSLHAQALSSLEDDLRPSRVIQTRVRGEGAEELVLERRWATLPVPSSLEVREVHSVSFPRVARLHVRATAGIDHRIELPGTAAIPGVKLSVEHESAAGPRILLDDVEVVDLAPATVNGSRQLALEWPEAGPVAGEARFNLLIAPGPPERWERLRGEIAAGLQRAPDSAGVPEAA